MGSLLVIYVETQKRQPHFRMRRFPLLLSFLLVLMILPNTAIYLTIYFNPALPQMTFLLFNAILGLGIGFTLSLTSFYIVYHPTKAR